ncbi:MAG: rhodanese-like domain-containing protein [Acidocella sp.]|nr:rhodanese-like domain-containing protein [Acidocella sp.]
MFTKIRSTLFAGVCAAALATSAAPAALAQQPAAPLVTPAWLLANLHQPGLVVVEVYDNDSQQPAFAAEHIPGAVFTGFLDDNWRVTRDNVPQMLPPDDVIGKVIGGFGISNNSRVVLVPAGATTGDFNATTRIYWTLRIEGQENVSILNGGDHAWLANSADPVATGAVTPVAATFTAHYNPALFATGAQIAANLTTHDRQMVDARPPAQYDGKVKSPVAAKAGTIPGALNLPTGALETADLEGVLDKPALLAALAKAGVSTAKPTFTFCNTGHLASADWFILHEVLNVKDVALYDGSMAEWTQNPAHPVVAGNSAF